MVVDLGLRSGVELLDLGAGAGWPGLYMARQTGCRVTLLDLPINGLRIAEQRAHRDGMSDLLTTVNASATDLPFNDAGFDAISHSDLLCCLVEKCAVLASCRRVIKPGGSMVFSVISVAPDLTAKQYSRARESGPEFIETDISYPAMLAGAGWEITRQDDVTEAFAETMLKQQQSDEANREGLERIFDVDSLTERRIMWESKIEALNAGLLRREIFCCSAERP